MSPDHPSGMAGSHGDGPSAEAVDAFIAKWSASGAGESANFQSFANELCALLGVAAPDPKVADAGRNLYVFEKAVPMDNGDCTATTKFADLFKADAFVCEAKQGSDAEDQVDLFRAPGKGRRKGTAVRGTGAWNRAMIAARNQADRYARFLGWPPFLTVVDVGHVIELYADFSGTGQNGYTPFPDPATHRVSMDDLRRPEVRARLARVWTDPLGLDPSKHAAKVTREVAAKLAELARSLEADGRAAASVAEFLMRCLFTMFAEDVELLPKGRFTALLKEMHGYPPGFAPAMEELWRLMNTGGKSHQMKADVRAFNGALFAGATAIPLREGQIALLIEAAEADWSHVEPAIFGTLLERALDPAERHKLGAHYTPRAYVERLVMPTIIEPLREEWAVVQATAMRFEAEGKHDEALDALKDYHRRLAATRVLDPACGSGNFLYVTLEHMKRLEGEVIDVLADLDAEAARLELAGHTVTPEQFLGIEVNARAAVIAEMVLWIGFLQWHFRTNKRAQVPAPVLRNYGNIECRDAVLAWDERRLRRDDHGRPITHWDGRTTKPHPVTGREVPDETAQIEDYEYVNPRPAAWPEAEYVVGNPPFVGNKRMRAALGDGYVEALHEAYGKNIGSLDFVMVWWIFCAKELMRGRINSFGLVTTNSITMSFNRRVLESFLNAGTRMSLKYAVPDHPWVDSADGADVRIAITVATRGKAIGRIDNVQGTRRDPDNPTKYMYHTKIGEITPRLSIGARISDCLQLKSNKNVSFMGVIPVGLGFCLTDIEIKKYGINTNNISDVIKPYLGGKDLTHNRPHRYIIDFWTYNREQAQEKFPILYQHVIDYVKPHRDHVKRKNHREHWWIFGEARPGMRRAIENLDRYIATTETSKHRWFTFLKSSILPDQKIRIVASDSGYTLGVLSARAHTWWAFENGGRVGVGNDPVYNNTTCFEHFPFPDPPDALKETIRALGEELDSHRKARQAAHPELTMTGMYNVLEALREGRPLTDKERDIHDKGLVGVLKDVHDRLDAAVIEAYGWPADVSDDEMLARLVALNKERAAEEAKGVVRWLRPEYQNPSGAAPKVQGTMAVDAAAVPVAAKAKWPAALPEQMRLVRGALDGAGQALTAEQVATAFKGARRKRVDELLATLVSIGQARRTDDGRFAAR